MMMVMMMSSWGRTSSIAAGGKGWNSVIVMVMAMVMAAKIERKGRFLSGWQCQAGGSSSKQAL